MRSFLRFFALLILLVPTLAIGQLQLPAAFQGMSPDQIQQALRQMSPAQLQTAAAGMSPAQIQQITQNQPEQATAQAPEPEAMGTAGQAAGEIPLVAEDEKPQPVELSDAASFIERLYRTNYESRLAKGLSQFGYDLFKSQPAGIPSRLAIPDPAYVLGPGDILRIRIWGSGMDGEYVGAINKEGSINVPKIGIVPVAGLKYGAVEGVIRNAAEKYVQGVNISVSIDQLRSIEVYVVGSVPRPGLHMVPAFSTVLGALMAGGGVEKSGSLRNIKLFRSGVAHRTVDIYELLLQGSRESDVILEDRDVVFVPRIGPTMAVAGAVAEPGIYELKTEKDLGQVLALAGNILPQSYTGRMHLRRFENNDEFVVHDIDTSDEKNDWRKIAVGSGDFLEVQLLADIQPTRLTVRLAGHVWMPDVFLYRPGLKLSDVLVSPNLLKPEAMTDYALLNRYDASTTRKTTHKFPLNEVFIGQYDAILQPLDEIQILSRTELKINETVEVFGAVWNPTETGFRPQMTVRDLLALGGGLREDQAFMEYGYLYRYDPALLDYRLQRIPLAAVLAGKQTVPLQPFDRVRILSRIDFDMRYSVSLAGAVWKPDTYDFNQGITLSDLIHMGGGTQYGADTSKIALTRKIVRTDRMDVAHEVVDLDQSKDLELKPYDYVFVPKLKDSALVREVSITGEVRYPGTYTIREDERLSELITRAGGFTQEAYFYGTQYRSANARRIQQNSLDKLMDDLEIRAKMFMSEQAQTGISGEDIEAAKASQMGLDAFIQKLRTVRADGRVAIQVSDLASFRGSNWDFVLDDGDALIVPKKPNFVAVVGAVYSPSAYLYQSEQTVADYLAKTGGVTKTADEKYIYLLKANGEVVASKNSGTFSNRFMSQALMPGDTIVVPEDLERVPYLRLTKDIADIVFKIAVTAGVAIAAL